MNRKVKDTIEEFEMLKDTTGIVVGFSGGADSMSLLCFLNAFCKGLNIRVYAAHVNHMLRGADSDKDEAFVRSFCEKNNIPLFVLKTDVALAAKKTKTGIEECGRKIRYDFFNECLKETKSEKIATAHTLSDSAETLIYHIARGTGLKGLRGIVPVRDNIIRPLIFVKREEVEEYCRENALTYVTDFTNFESRYTRNKIRLEIIPKLKELNPEFLHSVEKLTLSIAEDYECLETLADDAFQTARLENSALRINILSDIPPAIAKRCLKKAVLSYFNIEIDNKKLNSLYKLIKIGKTSNKLQLKKDFYAIISYDSVRFSKLEEKSLLEFDIMVKNNIITLPNGKTVEIIEKFNNLDNKNALDYDKIKGSIRIRLRKEGDRFTKKNGCGSKTLKRLFIDYKIPSALRQNMLVLYDEEEIIFVEGLGVSKSKAADENSKHIFYLNITGGNENAT